jgi:flagellar biosynthesis protein FliP
MLRESIRLFGAGAILQYASSATAQTPLEQAASTVLAGPHAGAEPLSYSLQVLLLMTLLAIVPTIVLMMTAFTRVIIAPGTWPIPDTTEPGARRIVALPDLFYHEPDP